MNTACPRRVSLISALGLPTILSPTIGATSGDRPAARRFGSRLSPALQASSFARRLAHPHRPNRVHRGCPLGQPVLRTGRSRSVALHPALLRCSYGSIPHSSSPHRSGLSPLYPTALSGARAPAYCRLTWSAWSKPATCRRSGLSAFRAEHEISELDVPQSGKREPTVSQNGRFGQNKRTLVIPLKLGHIPTATLSMRLRRQIGRASCRERV